MNLKDQRTNWKYILIVVILTFLGITVLAQEAELPSPGLTPDSPFYFIDTLAEKIVMFFTFGAEKKAEKAMQYAEEKLAEVKAMAEKNKIQALERANQKYQEFLRLANMKTQEAKEKGKDVEELAVLITEKTLKHQEVLIEIFEKVTEEAKEGIQKAIEVSRKGSEEAVQAVTGEKKEELLQKIEEVKIKAEERIKLEQLLNETADWKTYWNEITGYELKYPKDWKIVNVDWTVGREYVQFLSPLINNKYYFVLNFGARNKGDNTQISYQPDEDWELLKSLMRLGNKVKIGNVDVLTTEIFEKGKVHSILYSNRLGAGRVEISGLEIQANSGFIEGPQHLSASDVESIDLKNLPELKLANQILSTFKFIERKSEAAILPNTPVMLDMTVSTTAGAPYTISWRAVEEATNYILERDTDSSFSNSIIVSSRTLNSFSGIFLPSVSTTSTIYYFRVKACNKYGCSSWSKTTELWVEACPLPETPVLTDPGISVTDEVFTVKWTGVERAKTYRLQRDTNSNFSAPLSIPDYWLDYEQNSMTGNPNPEVTTTYYYRIKACNDCGCSPSWSNVVDMEVIVSPSITVIFPNGGENWAVGQTYKIEWQSSGLEKVTIDLFAYNSGGQVIKGFQHFIAKSIEATRGYYNWTIPEIADYPNYKLRIYNKLCIGGDADLLAECLKDRYFDESDGYFSIVE